MTMTSKRQRAGQRSRPAHMFQMLARLMILIVFFTNFRCCQGALAKLEEQTPNLDLISENHETKASLGASGLETDVDDPQGVFPKRVPPQHMLSSVLALEGDEESSGQTMINAADVSFSRRKRSVVSVGRDKPLEDQLESAAPRRLRLVSQKKRGVFYASRPWSVPSSSLSWSGSSQALNQRSRRGIELTGRHLYRTRRDAGRISSTKPEIEHHISLLTDTAQSAVKDMSSNLVISDTVRRQPTSRQKREDQSVFQWLSSRPFLLSTGTVRNRHPRDTKHQEEKDTPERQSRQAVNGKTGIDGGGGGSDGGGGDNGKAKGSKISDSEGDGAQPDDEDDEGNADDKANGADNSVDLLALRKKRMPVDDTAKHHDTHSGSSSLAERERRQTDTDRLADSLQDDIDRGVDDGEDDDDDDEGDDVDELMFKRKRAADRVQQKTQKGQQRIHTVKNISQNISSVARIKRGNIILHQIGKESSDDDDTDEDDDFDDDSANDLEDGLDLGVTRRKRHHVPQKRVVTIQTHSHDADSDEDEEDNDDNNDDDSDDTLKNALADMLDEMVDNDESLAAGSLRRKRSVSQFVNKHASVPESGDKYPSSHRLQRSVSIIRQILQEMAEEEDEEDEDDEVQPTDGFPTRRKRQAYVRSVRDHHFSKRGNFEDMLAEVNESEDEEEEVEAESTKLNNIALDMAADNIREDPEDYDDVPESNPKLLLKARRNVDNKDFSHHREPKSVAPLQKEKLGRSDPSLNRRGDTISEIPFSDRRNVHVPTNRSKLTFSTETSSVGLTKTDGNPKRIRRKAMQSAKLPPDVNDSGGINIPMNHPRSQKNTGPAVLPTVFFGQAAQVSAKAKSGNTDMTNTGENDGGTLGNKVNGLPLNSLENLDNSNTTMLGAKSKMATNQESIIHTQQNERADSNSEQPESIHSPDEEKAFDSFKQTSQNDESAGVPLLPTTDNPSTSGEVKNGNITTKASENEWSTTLLPASSTDVNRLSAGSSSSSVQDHSQNSRGSPTKVVQKRNISRQPFGDKKTRRSSSSVQDPLQYSRGSPAKGAEKRNISRQPFGDKKIRRYIKQHSQHRPWEEFTHQSLLSSGLQQEDQAHLYMNEHTRQIRSVRRDTKEFTPPQMPKRSIVVIRPPPGVEFPAPDVVTKYKDADRTLQDILDNALGAVPNPVPDSVPTVIGIAPEDDDDEDDDDDDDNDAEQERLKVALKDQKHGFIALSTVGNIKDEKERARNKVRLEKMKAQDSVRQEKNKAKLDLLKERKKAKAQLKYEKQKAKEELRQEKHKAKLALKEEERKAKQRIQSMLESNGRFTRDVPSDLEKQLKQVVEKLKQDRASKKGTNEEIKYSEKVEENVLDHLLIPGQQTPHFAVKEDEMMRGLTGNAETVNGSIRLSEKQKEQIVAETALGIDRAVHTVLQHIGENIRKTRDIEGDVIQELFKPEIEKQMEKDRSSTPKGMGKKDNTDHFDDDIEDLELEDDEEDVNRKRRAVDDNSYSDTTVDYFKDGNEKRQRRSSEDDYDYGEVFEDKRANEDEDDEFESNLLDKEDVQLTKRSSRSEPLGGFHAMSDVHLPMKSVHGAHDDEEEEDEEEDNKKEMMPDDPDKNIVVNKVDPDGQSNEEEPEEALVFEEEDEDGPNSGYTEWSEWGTCSVTCGVGRRERTRICEDQSRCHAGNVEEDVCIVPRCQTAL